jgi:hypothetical protein
VEISLGNVKPVVHLVVTVLSNESRSTARVRLVGIVLLNANHSTGRGPQKETGSIAVLLLNARALRAVNVPSTAKVRRVVIRMEKRGGDGRHSETPGMELVKPVK